MYRKPKPRFTLAADGSLKLEPIPPGRTLVSDVLYFLVGRLYLTYFVERQLAAGRGLVVSQLDAPVVRREDVAITPLHWKMILKTAELARDRGARLSIMTRAPAEDPESVRRFCREAGLGYLEMTLAKTDQPLALGPHDGHWNETGHRLAFERLAAQWADRFNVDRADPAAPEPGGT